MMEVCDTIEGEHDHDHDHGDGACALIGQDEHVWLSVNNAIRITEAISHAIQGVDVENAVAWQACEKTALDELTALRNEYTAMMETASHKTVVIADRYPFAYLFRDLGITCIAAFPGCSSETSASFATIVQLTDAVKTHELDYIFIMEGSDGKVAEVVAEETGAEILTLNSLQVVSDFEIDYLQVMRSNLENLKKALQ
jgi:zinc transport system substrate-binding protein